MVTISDGDMARLPSNANKPKSLCLVIKLMIKMTKQ